VPCLTIVSALFGILAGGLFMFFSTHLGLLLYFRSVLTSIELRDVVAGMIKSLAFATIIAHVGCLEGLRVRGGPDAVGRSTTSAVVRSTFMVIVADAVFTTIFYFMRRT
jgi:phospholipid/cholesterol/gamma-HCH transport system permease protein